MSPSESGLSSKMSTRFLVWGTPLLFAFIMLIQTGGFRNSKSVTYDETFYLSAALKTRYQGSLDERLCEKGVAPLPVLINYLPAVWGLSGSPREEIWSGEISDPPLVNRARLLNLFLIGIPTMLLVYLWLYLRRGYLAGALGAALITFSPTMIAHFSLATTDSCFTLMALITLAFLTRYWKQPAFRNLFWLATAVSLAVSAKYSGVFLLPCVLIIVALVAAQQMTVFSRAVFWTVCKRVTIVFTLFLALLIPLTWAFHLFSTTGPLKSHPYAVTPDSSPWVRILGRGPTAQWIMEVSHNTLKRPAPLSGILFQFQHNSTGHEAYLLGEVSKSGWWYYFPLTWLWKSTPLELLLTLLALILLPGLWRELREICLPAPERPIEQPQSADVERKQDEPTGHAPLVWLLATAVLLAMALTSRLNLGQRYLLILYPLLFLFTIDQVWPWLRNRSGLKYLFCLVCITLQVFALQSIKPNYLSYFNQLVGGPESGYRYLLDSNLDWGQDLPALKATMDELPLEDQQKSLLAYFGTTRPEAYGIKAHNLRTSLPEDPRRWKYMILSANYVFGLYTNNDPFALFRNLSPVKRVGYTMFIYDLQTPEGREALQHVIDVSNRNLEYDRTHSANTSQP